MTWRWTSRKHAENDPATYSFRQPSPDIGKAGPHRPIGITPLLTCTGVQQDARGARIPQRPCQVQRSLYGGARRSQPGSRSDGEPTKVAVASHGLPHTSVRYSDARSVQLRKGQTGTAIVRHAIGNPQRESDRTRADSRARCWRGRLGAAPVLATRRRSQAPPLTANRLGTRRRWKRTPASVPGDR